MLPARAALPAHVRLLLESLVDPRRCTTLDERHWEVLLRTARRARLLGVLAARAEAALADTPLPDVVQRQLAAGRLQARHRRQKTLFLLQTIAPVVRASAGTAVLLKGAAYIAQELPLAAGRLPADVDLMVPRTALDGLERALLAAGWQFEKSDPYDQHYYRAWSHELPPLQCAGQALELDLHHTVLPPLGRLKPDTEALFAAAVPIDGTPFLALAPADQLLHAAAHLFHDSDCTDRLRDLVDFDALVRHLGTTAAFWTVLLDRARLHRLTRPLWYALAAARAWLDTPIPDGVERELEAVRPPWLARTALGALAARTLPPGDPDGSPRLRDLVASVLLQARAAWLRMPPWLVAYHALNKLWRGVSARRATAG